MTYSNANFTPDLKGYSNVKPFRFWCQKVLPLVYDDSLSYYELLCKVVDYINNIIDDLSATEDNVASLLDAYNQLQDYVNNYFTNLDVQEEINNKLDDLVEDGTLTTLIGNYIQPRIDEIQEELDDYETEMTANFNGLQSATESNLQQQNDKIFVLEGRMDTFTQLTQGSTTGDAELQDIRVAYDGTIYPTAGDAVRGQVSALKNALNNVYVTSDNLYNPATDRHGKDIDNNGVISDNANSKVSDYIYVGENNKFTAQTRTGNSNTGLTTVFFYTNNNESSFSRRLYATVDNQQTFTLAPNEKYIVLGMREESYAYMVNKGETLLPYSPYGGEMGTVLTDAFSNVDSKIENIDSRFDFINLFNTETISDGKFINVNNGNLSTNSNFFASDFIYIGNLTNVTISYTHLFGWYDENKEWLGHPDLMNSIANDITIEVPENAVYLRFSTYNDNINNAQVGESVSRNNYIQYGVYKLPELRVEASQVNNEKKIVVDATGNGDYTSFTQAIYDTVDSGVNVIVKPGIYDIVSEYIALFGQSAVDSMADSDSAIFNGFQYGVRLRNRNVEFTAGAHLVCDWTGHTVNGTHRFSALGVDYNVEITGLDLDATGTFYAIHDDYGISGTPYTVKYENCRVVGHNLYNANCIGGGCKKYSKHILNNCYFNNNLTGTTNATVRYHNTNNEGAEPEIYVSNCYFSNVFSARWFGNQTSKMKVYVNNCEAVSINKMAESSSYNVDNVELYKWCNTESN